MTALALDDLPDGVRIAKRLFLRAFAETANVAMAAREAGVHRQRVYEWRHTDPDFELAFLHAREEAYDALEAEAWRRAVDGWDEPVFFQGQEVGLVRRFSDRLLEVLLRGARPERYKPTYRVESSTSESRLGELASHEHQRMVLASPEVAVALAEVERAVSRARGEDAEPIVEAEVVDDADG